MSSDDPMARLDAAQRSALSDHVSRLKHDLGKYVSLQIRWLGDDADADARREALRSDLLSTRRGPDGEQDAVSVWAEFRPGLVGEDVLDGGVRADLTGDPTLARLDASMATVSEVAAALADGDVAAATVARGEAAAREVADACRRLHRRLRDQGG